MDLSYRVTIDGHDLTFGHHEWDGTTRQLADAAAANTSVSRPWETGALTVHVWPTRDDEHYRLPVPNGAETYHYPARTGQEA